jgi:uncharacterized protein involved in exopolysaccharide biosynthesis
MIDDEPAVPDGRDAQALLYDFFKWITTLSLLTLGAILSLSQSADLKLTARDLLLVLGPLSLASVVGLTGAEGVVRNRLTGHKPRIKPSLALWLAVGSLGLGTGAFLSLFWDVLQ